MTDQFWPDLVYGVLLLLALLTPFVTPSAKREPSSQWPAIMAVLALAIVLTVARRGDLAPCSLVLLLPLIGTGAFPMLGGIAALLLFAPAVWWMSSSQISPWAIGAFLPLGLLAAYLPRLPRKPSADPPTLPVVIACLLLGLCVGLLTAPFGAPQPIYLSWHHWGAYLAPVDAWLSGGVPYRDFPVQYGLGPTVLLAATCGSDCWRGIYFAAVAADAIYFAVLAGCITLLTAGRSVHLRWLALLALFCSCFIWTGFPSNFGSTAMTPSVAGLRFLPLAALLLHLLHAEHSNSRRDWIGHLIWLCDLFWSPEAGFFATLVWWPYLALRDTGGNEGISARFAALLRGALRGAAALAAGAVGLALLLWLIVGGPPRLSDFLAYISHPPGPLPVDPTGTVWLAIIAILLAINALGGARRASDSRMLYVCLLSFLASGTYFLSRSHDNNILNLFPLMIPLLLATARASEQADAPQRGFPVGFARTLLAAMVAFIVTVDFSPWIEGASRDGLFHLGPDKLIARFTPQQQDRPALLSRDALTGLAWLRAQRAEAVVLLDDRKLIPWHGPGTGWTSVNNVANFESLPTAMVARYICRGAAAYRKPGWLLVDERSYGAWIVMYRAAYDVQFRGRFGRYGAYWLRPRPDRVKSCSTMIR